MAEMTPSSPEVSKRMSLVRNRDTAAELAIRHELHRRGLRYRVSYPIPGLGTRPDIVFTRARVAVFVDGCFWHRCPEHATFPATNAKWWAEKLEMNVHRDRATNERLIGKGWVVVRIWEHEHPIDASQHIEETVNAAQGRRGRS